MFVIAKTSFSRFCSTSCWYSIVCFILLIRVRSVVASLRKLLSILIFYVSSFIYDLYFSSSSTCSSGSWLCWPTVLPYDALKSAFCAPLSYLYASF